MFDIGMTGTKEGMTFPQRIGFRYVLSSYWMYKEQEGGRFHHGDCIGADEQGALIATHFGYYTVSHPPIIESLRAFHKSDLILPPKPYIDRDHDIVDISRIIIGTPKTAKEILRSGTWATIRFAKKLHKEHFIIDPDGTIHHFTVDGKETIRKEYCL